MQCSLCRSLSTEIIAVGKTSIIRSCCQKNEAGLACTSRDDRSFCQPLSRVERRFLSYVITDIALYKSLEYVCVPFFLSCSEIFQYLVHGGSCGLSLFFLFLDTWHAILHVEQEHAYMPFVYTWCGSWQCLLVACQQCATCAKLVLTQIQNGSFKIHLHTLTDCGRLSQLRG